MLLFQKTAKAIFRSIAFSLLILAPFGWLQADIFRILDEDKEALQCRIDLIQQAEREILLSYYIVNDDVLGNALFYLLVEASQQRGVKVHLLVDAFRSRIAKPTIAYLEENGVTVQVFNPGRLFKPRSITHRLHDKIFMTDARSFITGGRNLKRDYYELGETFNFTDRDVLVQGEAAVKEARIHFFSIWNNRKLSFIRKTKKLTEKQRIQVRQQLKEAIELLQRQNIIRLHTQTDWTNVPPTASPVFFEHDDFFVRKGNKMVETDIKDLRSTKAFIGLVNRAKHSIVFENAYVIPTRRWRNALKKAAERGVSVRILTNSIATNDVMIAQAAYLNQRKKLLKMGIELWEYRMHERTLHTKAGIIDDTISIVGSYNLHAVSQKWTTEVLAWVADPDIARQHKAMMDKNLEYSIKIGPNNRPVFPDGITISKPPLNRRIKTFLARYSLAYVFALI